MIPALGDAFFISAIIASVLLVKDSLKILFLKVLLPNNFYLTASYGGKYDYLINEGYFTRYSKVVFSEDEAKKLGLEIDVDDSLCFQDKPFALLLHGLQEKNTASAEALKIIKRNKVLPKIKDFKKIDEKIKKVENNQLKNYLSRFLKAYNERNN